MPVCPPPRPKGVPDRPRFFQDSRRIPCYKPGKRTGHSLRRSTDEDFYCPAQSGSNRDSGKIFHTHIRRPEPSPLHDATKRVRQAFVSEDEGLATKTDALLAGDASITEIDELRPLIAEGQERGFLTFEQIATALEEVEVSKEQVTELHAYLEGEGIDVVGADDRVVARAHVLNRGRISAAQVSKKPSWSGPICWTNSSSTPASPRSSFSTIASSSRCASSKVSSVNGRPERTLGDTDVERISGRNLCGRAHEVAAPVDDRLFFAGEACSTNDYSTAHGAYLTGVVAADQAIAARRGRRPR